MFEYLSYILCFGLLIIFTIYIYIRMKYGFWVSQPVLHIYDLGYRLNPPGVIDVSLPNKNKYNNFREIDTISVSDLTSIQIQRFANLIKNDLQNESFTPQLDNIMPYFIGHNNKSFVSFFYKDDHIIDLKKGNVIIDRKIIGSITSRPIYIIINNGDNDAKIYSYYIDHLYVDKLDRKKEIIPQLIQTHIYNNRLINTKLFIFIFKSENLPGVIPLCKYSIYKFPVDKWSKPLDLSSEYKILEINKLNFRYLYDFIITNTSKFDIVVSVESTNIIELIKTKNVFVYVILCDEKIISCYFFRKTCIQIDGLNMLNCFASICDCDNNIFIHGFKISFWKIAADNYMGIASIENTSHNGIIINNIIHKTIPYNISYNSYFFYNFAYTTFKPEKCLIIN
jgi:hypothetical protein